jgi:diaminopimelate epimerase
MRLPFIKMNGAGNDFVVLDARLTEMIFTPEQIRDIATRSNEITGGCDQVIIMESSKKADVFMRIYNADGGEVDACGNATRCIGWKIVQEKNDPLYHVKIETNAGTLWCRQVVSTEFPAGLLRADAMMEADMGSPRFDAGQIPVSGDYNDAALARIAEKLGLEEMSGDACVGMGNPHVVFFVAKLPSLKLLETAGEQIKEVLLFKKHGVNLTIATVGKEAIFAYVYERGAGITKSCGTAACATGVAAIKLGYRQKDKDIWVQQLQSEAEDLFVRWEHKSDQVFLIGPVKKEFERVLNV